MIDDAIFMFLRLAGIASTVIGILLLLIGLIKGIASKKWKLFIWGLIACSFGVVMTIVSELGWGMYQLHSYEGTPFERAQRGLNQAPIER